MMPVLLALLTLPLPPTEPPPVPPAPVAVQPTVPSEHIRLATAAFDLGHYDIAARRFEAAYGESLDARALFQAAESYRLMGKPIRARTLYQSYLRVAPEGELAVQAGRWVADIDQRLAFKDPWAPETRSPPGVNLRHAVTPPERAAWQHVAIGGSLGLAVGLLIGYVVAQ